MSSRVATWGFGGGDECVGVGFGFGECGDVGCDCNGDSTGDGVCDFGVVLVLVMVVVVLVMPRLVCWMSLIVLVTVTAWLSHYLSLV